MMGVFAEFQRATIADCVGANLAGEGAAGAEWDTFVWKTSEINERAKCPTFH
jgi:hypothetical protein